MISVAPIGAGLVCYLTNQAQERYYFEGGESPGTWCGSASSHLRLCGQVRRQDLRALTHGFALDGSKLVQNAGKFDGEKKRNRHRGISIVLNAQKSLSMVWAFAEPAFRERIEAAFERAAKCTIHEFIEPEIARCRTGDGTEVAAKLAAAMFIHASSREQDAHYHAHVVLPNIGLCSDGRTRALVSKRFYDWKLAAGAFFRVCLEHECQQLGLQFHRPLNKEHLPKDHSEVTGVPRELCRHFSKRRAQIEQQLAAKGLQSAAASSVATLQTRRAKEEPLSRPQLYDRWRAEAREHGLSLDWLRNITQQPRTVDDRVEYNRALQSALEICTQQEGHFQRKDIYRATLVSAQGVGGVDPVKLHTYLHHDLEHSQTFVNLGVRGNQQRYTTPEVLRVEQEILADVSHLQAARFKPISNRIVQKVCDKQRRVNPCQATTPAGKIWDAVTGDKSTFTLDDEQKACVRYATQDPGRVKIIHGPPGTSKTTVVGVIAEAYRRAGWKIQGAAVAGVAAKNLQEKTGIPCDTLQMTLMRLYPSRLGLATHHVKQLWRAARGLPTYKPNPLKLTSRSVLFVDEAAMVGTRDFALITHACAKAKASLVLIGDHQQLPAIDAGGAFKSLIDKIPSFELKDIKRQEKEVHRQRVAQLSRGEAKAVIEAYARDGNLHVARTHEDAQRKLIQDWANNGGAEKPRDHAIFAATNREVRTLNDLAQQTRIAGGHISTRRSVTVGGETFCRGERVRFAIKSRKLGVENGDAGTIVAIRNNPLCAAVKVRLDGENGTREIPLRTLIKTHYRGLTRGYAMTVHKMQSRGVDHAYYHLGGRMTDRELTYVAFSRHQKSLHIYCDENHAGVELTNMAREATGDGPAIRARPGLKPEYSPLVTHANNSRAKTLAVDHDQSPGMRLRIEPEGGSR